MYTKDSIISIDWKFEHVTIQHTIRSHAEKEQVYTYSSLWGKMPNLQKQKIENMSIFLASWRYLMVLIDNSSFFVIKHCTFNV